MDTYREISNIITERTSHADCNNCEWYTHNNFPCEECEMGSMWRLSATIVDNMVDKIMGVMVWD